MPKPYRDNMVLKALSWMRTMKRILLFSVIIWSLVGAPLQAVAQSPELTAANQQYEALSALGKYAEAEVFARKALKLGEAEFGTDIVYASLLGNLARLFQAQGRYGDAEPLFRRALSILKKTSTPTIRWQDCATKHSRPKGLARRW